MYKRDFPRDLFNDANLLKCLGKLYLDLMAQGLEDHFICDGDMDDTMRIDQDPDTGETFCPDIHLCSASGRVFELTRPLNSREEWPLEMRDREAPEQEWIVFGADGKLLPEFSKLLNDTND